MGRDDEVREAVRLTGLGGVIIAGPEGIGKSRVARETLLEYQADREIHIRASRAAARMPLGAFAALIPESPFESALDDARSLQSLAREIVGDTSIETVVLVEDVHLLDDVSATFLLQLALMKQVKLILTLATSYPVPAPITTLWSDMLIGRIDLQPLPPEIVDRLIEVALGAAVDELTRRTLIRASGGNLLYLRELIVGLRASGILAEVSSTWILLGPVTAPPRLVEVIRGRISHLSPPALRLLQTVALSEPIGIGAIQKRGPHAMEALHVLQEEQLVDIEVSGNRQQVVIMHPMYGEVAQSMIPVHERQRMLRNVAQAIMDHGLRRRDDSRRAAGWLLEAGETPDPAVLVDAANEAHKGSERTWAEQFARAALGEYLPDLKLDPDDELRFRAAQLLGLSLSYMGRFDEAESILSKVDQLPNSSWYQMALAFARSENSYFGLHDDIFTFKYLEEAIERIPDASSAEEVQANLAMLYSLSAQFARARELAEPLIESDNNRAQCRALTSLALCEAFQGQAERAASLARCGFDLRIHLGDQPQFSGMGLSAIVYSLCEVERGAIAVGLELARTAYEGVIGEKNRQGQAWAAVTLSRAYLMHGNLSQAERVGREGALAFAEIQHPGAGWGYFLSGMAAAQSGDAVAARAAAEGLENNPIHPMHALIPETHRFSGWIAVAENHLDEAETQFLEAAQLARHSEQFGMESEALHDLVRIGRSQLVVQRLEELTHLTDSAVVVARSNQAWALLNDDPERLLTVADEFEGFGMKLIAAEIHGQVGQMYRDRNRERLAARADREMAMLLNAVGRAATPALQTQSNVNVLTKREREIALLAVRGASNKQIAQQLHLSTRTVENHLQRAYGKLGVRSRDELTDAIESPSR